MKIKLDNLDHDDGFVLVLADWKDAETDQSIEGCRWERDGDFVYTLITDSIDLVERLEKEGYEVNTDDYCQPEEFDYYAYSPGDGPYD